MQLPFISGLNEIITLLNIRVLDRMISARSESGVLDTPTAEEARRRSSAQSGGEGRGVIGWGIWAVLLEL
jgi:hypothetical protein